MELPLHISRPEEVVDLLDLVTAPVNYSRSQASSFIGRRAKVQPQANQTAFVEVETMIVICIITGCL